MSVQRYSTIQTCPDQRCDRYCDVKGCTPNNIVCEPDKRCKVYFCNNEKLDAMNKKIFERMTGECNQHIVPDYRPEFKMCGANYDNKNIIDNADRNLRNHITNFECLPNCMQPGMGSGLEYLRRIDIDSHLKRYDKPATLCDPPKHQRPPCKEFLQDPTPTIPHHNPFHRDGAVLTEIKSTPLVPIRYMDVPKPCGATPFPMVEVNMNRSYPPRDPCICTFEPIRMTDQDSDPRKKYDLLVPASHTIDRVDKPVLIVGPERCDSNKATNLWNNMTSRRMVSDTLEHYY